jgi:predicted glycoside hydrolase/deacetylase ChbG (UPF0249 family)
MIQQEPIPDLSILEKLGYSTSDKLLILHADDLGMCHSANLASIKGLKERVVSSASVMVPCPWLPEIAAWSRENPEFDLGLHLTLTSEWKYYRWRPVAPIDKVKGLLDEEGFMWHDVPQVIKSATPQEVETELRAQIERALQFGMKPTHIDSHMGTLYSDPRFFEIFVKLGAEYKIPPMLMEATPELIAMARGMGIDYMPLYRMLKEKGFPMLTYLNPQYEPGRAYSAHRKSLHDFIRNLKPGITELIVHLGMDDPEGRAVSGNWQMRIDELKILIEPRFRTLLKEWKIKLFTYREMAKAWKT